MVSETNAGSKSLTPSEYIAKIKEFVVVPEEHMEAYLTTLLASEAGECIGLYGKKLRGDFKDIEYGESYREKMLKELGDVCFSLCLLGDMLQSEMICWQGIPMEVDEDSALSCLFDAANNVLQVAYGDSYKGLAITDCWTDFRNALNFYGFTLEQVFEANINKLEARKAKGTIMGSGERE